MAEDENEIKRIRHGASLRCKLKGCNGEPKKKIEATQFIGSYCEKCFACYDYVPLNKTAEDEFKERNKNKKLEIKEIDKVKTKQKQKGDQMNFEF